MDNINIPESSNVAIKEDNSSPSLVRSKNKKSSSDSNMLTLSSPASDNNSNANTPPGSPPPQQQSNYNSIELPPSPTNKLDKDFPQPHINNVKYYLPEDERIGLISASTLANAIDNHYASPLPEVDKVFPWLHGVHPTNISQRAFLDPLKRFRDRPFTVHKLLSEPIQSPIAARGLMLIKVGDVDNKHGSLVGSVTPEEILEKTQDNEDTFEPNFLFLDPDEGISLRNFYIQVAKWACISDIVVYSPNFNCNDDGGNVHKLVVELAKTIVDAQKNYRTQHPYIPEFKTFLVDDNMDQVMDIAPHIVAVPPSKCNYDEDELRLKNWDSNFLFHERVEMSMMSSASPIGGDEGSSVWLGNTSDFETFVEYYHRGEFENNNDAVDYDQKNWATFVECFDGAQLPSIDVLYQYIKEASTILDKQIKGESCEKNLTPLSIQFPCSGALSLTCCSDDDFFAIVALCHLLYLRSNVTHKQNNKKAGILLYCNDGYTETSLLALAYLIYSNGLSTPQAWIDLHVKYGRPFFCFPCDVVLLIALGPILRKFSPALIGLNESTNTILSGEKCTAGTDIDNDNNNDNNESWFSKLDGSLPSRILPHMYLGSLIHAENPDLLVKLGIKRILSVGETLSWMNYESSTNFGEGKIYENPYSGINQVMYMDNIQDDGVDALMDSLTSCLDFLDEGYQLDEPILVHCRVGVSRSATVCIAEVMKRLGVGLPRAYLFVRVRRLNVIIQPNLRFMFELVKWEELHRRSGEGWLREVDWHILCREISIMNKAYIA